MRRKDKEITDANTLKSILKLTKHVTIAICKNNQPYLATLSHGYDETRNCIYFHCAKEGKKIDYIKSNNIAWGQAMLDYGYSEGKCDHQFATVQFKGKVTLLDDLDEKRQALQCMIRQLEKNPEQMIEKTTRTDAEKLKGTVFGRIDIEYMSGKKSEKLRIQS